MTEERKDRRGTPKGAGTIDGKSVGGAGGRIGNPPHVPTDEQRREVATLAKVASQEVIATVIGVSIDTLDRHYRKELDQGSATAIVAVGGKLLQKALSGHSPSINFYLATRGKGSYSRRVEVTGAGGGAFRHIDLGDALRDMSDEQLSALEPILARLLAEGGVDIDGDDQVSAPTD